MGFRLCRAAGWPKRLLLLITAAGLKALGIEPAMASAAEAPQGPRASHTDSPASAESLSAPTVKAALESPSAAAGQGAARDQSRRP
jgi:hypothetical protein